MKKFHEEWMKAEIRTRAMLKGVKGFPVLFEVEDHASRTP